MPYQRYGEKGLNINCSDSLGNRPLHHAVLAGERQTVILLLQLGADPQLKNNRSLFIYFRVYC